MNITAIKIRKVKKEGTLKAYVDITFDDCLVIHNAKVVEGKNNLIVCFPSTKIKKTYKDIIHPITSEFRKYITDEVIARYKELNK